MGKPPVPFAVIGIDTEFVEDPYAVPVVFIGVPVVGACGTVVAVTPAEAADAAEVPTLLPPVTVYVY